MSKKQLSKKDIKELNEVLKKKYDLDNFISKKSRTDLQDDIIFVDAQPCFFYQEGQIIPTLKLLLKNNFLKTATIDMPAVPFIAKGSDLMRPGIKKLDDFEKGDLVSIIDENNKKPLAICRAEYSSQEIRSMEKGNVLKNIHHVGDEIWSNS